MPIVLAELGIAYHPSPKCGCTSIKSALYKLVKGRDYEEDATSAKPYIHHAWGTFPFKPVRGHYYRFCVVRDPVERFLSAYRNRVLQHGQLAPHHLGANPRGLPANPDLRTFVERLEEYREISVEIAHHTDPQVSFVGHDPAYYSRVFHFADLPALPAMLEQDTGHRLIMPHLQKGLAKAPVELDARHRKVLERYYVDDFAFLAASAADGLERAG